MKDLNLRPFLGGITAPPVLSCAALLVLSCTALLTLGCAAENNANTTQPGDGGASPGGATSSNHSAGCSPSKGTTGNPKSIYEVLDLINALPRPVTLPCFLESLDRPLALNANFNTQSAQPAMGKRSPRIFVLVNESLSMSLVPGAEAQTLEFGERDASGANSVKGELHFPVEGQLVPDDAFSGLSPDESTGLTLDQGTSCGVCHNNEATSANYPFRGAFASAIVKPAPFFAVKVEAIQQERDACDSAEEPERCAVLEALFDHGEVVQAEFP
jgi:hypothetical protein